MQKSHSPKICTKTDHRNAKHTVSANAHKSGSLKIVHHKGGRKKTSGKKTIL